MLYGVLVPLAGARTRTVAAPMIALHCMRLTDSNHFTRCSLAQLRSERSLTKEQEAEIKPVVVKTCADMETIQRQTVQRALDRLMIPVTLAVGLHDSWVPPHDADRIAMRLVDARIVEVREGGHFAHEDVPDELERIIVEAARNAGLLAGLRVAVAEA